ncbi:Probable RNA-directed DNA polymerase from transposon BS [Eumeta japonica]|uniref:Probable RNA-directed DNA polymerase from transposon BS n=2 Tax=Eumeta variegata TaxID=151549 RepID=A0A4C1VS81_EUMVA|nr:Probable RNA-directed DNA polymerase from transposon BS [Eumeta japonica]
MSENSIDIALVQETYLKPNRPKACSIAGYVQLRTDRTYSSKGLGLSPVSKRLLRRDLRALFALGDAVILFGDFNCKTWGCPSNNYNGIKLDELEDRLDFGIIAPLRRHVFPMSSHRPSTIDIALTKGVALNFNSIETIHGLTSDHRPVILKMGPPDGGRPIPIRKITNWKRVSTALEKIDTPNLNSIPNDIASTDEIDLAIGALTNHVRTVVEESEREVPASSDRRKFPPDILELIRAKNAALRRASAYPTPEYRSRARALQREVKARVREFRNESWSDLMEEIKPSHKAFWAVTKALKTEGYTPIPPLKKPDNSEAIDDAEIAECLADSIETQCSHASPPHDIAHISRIEEEVLQKTSLEPKDDLAPVSLSEVQTLVKSLNTRKAPGLDGISNKAIKCFSIPLLLTGRDFNACIKNCYFPPAWKEAEVIGIHKPGKPRDLPASYRPISLLSGLGKLFEKILKTRLSDHLLGKGLIIDEQFGFRPAHSCPQQVLRLVEYVSEGFETERSTVAVFFDVAKAFDRQTDISHLGMSALTRQDVLSEQEFLKAPPSLLCCTRVHKRCTATVVVWRPTRVIRGRYRALYGNRNRSTRFTPPLQRAIDELGQWFRKWRIEVNPDKSAAIQFKYGVTLDKNLHFRDHIERVRNTALFYKARLGAVLGRKSKLSRRNKRTIYKMCIRTVMTYASPVFAHAAPKALHRLQVIQNKFCRAATDAHWCVRNSILHRDLELPTISKYMKDASKRFFDIAGSHPNALLRAAVDYQPPHPTHLIRRPRNVLTDPPDALTAAVESLNDVNDTHD